MGVYGLGWILGLSCGLLLVAAALNFLINKAGWDWAGYGRILLLVVVLSLLISLWNRRKHVEPVA